ncbi:MAG: nitroreductase family protein [Bacillota bacterium]
MQAIWDRRSIRKFEERPVPKELVERILEAATRAPSGKNAQPWYFMVLQGKKKDMLADLMMERVIALREQGVNTGSAGPTARTMRQAPVAILVYNPRWTPDQDRTGFNRFISLVDTQSVGAAVQNITLAATALGLGTLWIGDIFCAEDAVGRWLGMTHELVCAVSLGYPAEAPPARPRKSVAEVTRWLE